MTAAIAFVEDGIGVLSAVRERKPPFSPEAVAAEFADFFKEHGVSTVIADKWGSEFVTEAFARHDVKIEQSAKPKSDVYRELLPLINSGRVKLLDDKRLITQLCNLERRTARGGRDSIDHPAGGRDDLINAASLALIAVAGGKMGALEILQQWGNRMGDDTYGNGRYLV